MVRVRERIIELLSRGEPPQKALDEFVTIDVVPRHMGPLLCAGLEREGFETQCLPAYNLVTRSTTDARILVRRRDSVAAIALLDELR